MPDPTAARDRAIEDLVAADEQDECATPKRYPAPVYQHYGRWVWPLGEDADCGVMIEGHGRRAYAALAAHYREELEPLRSADRGRKVWVRFREGCGCTTEQHAEHLRDGEGCPCEEPLPPCDAERFAWTYESVTAGTPDALPVLEVTW